jgi:N-acetylglucosaminyl-diphospho-decaprenol L-rhamnosyltransferase
MFYTTIILITYKSDVFLFEFIKKIPRNFRVIIIENSNNHKMKKDIEKRYSNIDVYLKENNGVGSALNYAVKKIKTKYFLQISPDINFDFNDILIFTDFAKKLNDRFAAIGPKFLDVKKKGHKQISENVEYDSIDSIHGSCMFINKECYNKIGGFDENYFLYFEETDYCYRGKKLGYKSYQVNKSKVRSKGRSVDLSNDDEKISNILHWHFIWSNFYFNKKKYGKLISLLVFLPTMIRIIFKISLNKIIKNKKQLNRYKIRYDGLINSIKGNKSSLRP